MATYLITSEIFGSPPIPEEFADAYIGRAAAVLLIDKIKRERGLPVRNIEVEITLLRRTK